MPGSNPRWPSCAPAWPCCAASRDHSLVRDNTKLGEYTIRDLAPLPAGEQAVHVRFTYDLNGILEVDMTVAKTGRTETLVIEGSASRLSSKQLAAARAARSSASRSRVRMPRRLPSTAPRSRALSSRCAARAAETANHDKWVIAR